MLLKTYVFFSAKDILSIEIISTENTNSKANDAQTQSKVNVKRPIAKRAGRSLSECVISPAQSCPASSSTCTRKTVEMPSQAEPSTNGRGAVGNTKFWINKIFYWFQIFFFFK